MQIVRSIQELGPAVAELQRRGTVALVPTMGALHPGHLELVAEGCRRADQVVASIFVNPLQFGENEDFGRYPRQERLDYQMLNASGVALTWVPTVEDIYHSGFSTKVSVSGVADRWEGAARPGHFDGVATVVAKLLMAVRPNTALFGEKDFQQLAVVRQMVRDLAVPVDIVGVPTVREADGLALSSRNAYLSGDERKQAVALPEALDTAAEAIRRGEPVERVLVGGEAKLRDAGFSTIDYFALVDAQTLLPIEAISGPARLLAAATIGTTRLIDNVPV